MSCRKAPWVVIVTILVRKRGYAKNIAPKLLKPLECVNMNGDKTEVLFMGKYVQKKRQTRCRTEAKKEDQEDHENTASKKAQ